MPCDTKLKPNQTIQQRKLEILDVVKNVIKGLTSGRIKAKVSAQGGVTFAGLEGAERNDVTDACVYRRLLASGSALAIAQVQKAEQMAGRKVDVHGSGHHSHDGGKTWHHNH